MPLALLVAACDAIPTERGDKPMVLTTFSVIADIAQNVAGEELEVHSLIDVGVDVHSYTPTPTDLRTASRADLIVDNGLGLELWFDAFYADIDAPRVVISEGVDEIEIDSGALSGQPNPHAWMSPSNVEIYVDNLLTAFTELDPDNAQVFQTNAESYTAELTAIQEDLEEGLAQLESNQRALVTCEGAFSYLTRDAGLDEQYLWPVNADSEATPQRITATINFVNEREVPALFCESTVRADAMEQVAQATGAPLAGRLYVDSLSEPDGPVPTYLDLIRYDLDLILSGLSGEPIGGAGA